MWSNGGIGIGRSLSLDDVSSSGRGEWRKVPFKNQTQVISYENSNLLITQLSWSIYSNGKAYLLKQLPQCATTISCPACERSWIWSLGHTGILRLLLLPSLPAFCGLPSLPFFVKDIFYTFPTPIQWRCPPQRLRVWLHPWVTHCGQVMVKRSHMPLTVLDLMAKTNSEYNVASAFNIYFLLSMQQK